jgi:uncharacterized protein YjiS (DUF1127 family)
MTTQCIPHPIPLHRSLAATLLDGVLERAGTVARAVATHWAAYAAWRREKRADRALAELSLHTLCDIGAVQARTERRRELERQESERLSRILANRGW